MVSHHILMEILITKIVQTIRILHQRIFKNNQPLTFEKRTESLLEILAQQNQSTIDLYNTYVGNNSSQKFLKKISKF